MRKEKILIIDDEPEISHLLYRYLSRENYEIIITDNGLKAMELVRAHDPDLILLDILLPGLDGLSVCQKIRHNTKAPILFLSCKDEDSDKVLGLGVGGDDYVTKPFSPSVVVARIKAHLRRNQFLKSQGKDQFIRYPGLEIDTNSYTVLINGNPLSLPAKEFQLLTILARNPNRLFSTEQLFDLVWQEDNFGDSRTVVVHLSNLRKKLESDPQSPKYIVTVRGVGYKFSV